eukprot:127018-Amphidinium_carterae.1
MGTIPPEYGDMSNLSAPFRLYAVQFTVLQRVVVGIYVMIVMARVAQRDHIIASTSTVGQQNFIDPNDNEEFVPLDVALPTSAYKL